MFKIECRVLCIILTIVYAATHPGLLQLDADLINMQKMLNASEQVAQISDNFYQATLKLIQASKQMMVAQQLLFQAIADNTHWLKVSDQLQKTVQDTINAHKAMIDIFNCLPIPVSMQEQKILKHLSGKIVIATQHEISCKYFVIKLLPQLLDNRSFVIAARLKLKSTFNPQVLKEKTGASFWQDAFEFIQVPYNSTYEKIQAGILDKQQNWLPLFNPGTIEELFALYPQAIKSDLIAETRVLEKALNQYIVALSDVYTGPSTQRTMGQTMIADQFKSIDTMLKLCSTQDGGLASCIAQQLAGAFAEVNKAANTIFQRLKS